MKDQFTGTMFRKALKPCLISSLGLALADMADAIVMGQKMGETGLAAISLSLPVYMIMSLILFGFAGGGSIRFARLLGEGEDEAASTSFSMIMETAVCFSLVMAVAGNLCLAPLLRILGTTPADGELYQVSRSYIRIIVSGFPLFFISHSLNCYLRNDDFQELAGAAFVAGNVSDILLSIILVLGLEMGAAGAGYATLAGQSVTILLFLWGMGKKEHHLKFAFCVPDFRQVYACFRVGAATSSQYGFNMLFFLIANNCLIRIGGERGVAVFDLVQNATYLVVYLYEGIAKAMQPLLSTFVTEHNHEARKHVLRQSFLWGSGLCMGVMMLLEAAPQLMCRLFGLTDPGTMGLGMLALRIYGAGVLFGGINILTENAYQACEKEKPAFVISVLRGAVVLIPVTLAVSGAGLSVFWLLFPATEVLSLALFHLWKRQFGEQMDSFDDRRVFAVTIEGDYQNIGGMTDQMESFCEQWEATAAQRFFCVMAAEEMCLSILEKGFEKKPGGYIQVTLVALEEGLFELHIRDNAVSFNPFSLETEKAGEGRAYDMDALGIYVIKQKAKSFFYRRYQGFNTMVVRI
ncbi:MAG: MATE family efflux transporter [Eubacteriales bacterium]|nr:MATE family efflux transporter [Eubacteriales bacterium]